eukprot:tig00000615_g2593.t1
MASGRIAILANCKSFMMKASRLATLKRRAADAREGKLERGRGRGGSRGRGRGGGARGGWARGGGARGGGGSRPGNEGKQKKKNISVKNQIRALERLINKPNLDDDTRAKHQQRLDELKQTADDKQRKEKEKAIASKYRMVRFFEKRKLMRKIAQTEKKLQQIEDDEEGSERLSEKLASLQEDMNYVKYYPKGVKYIALFPKGEMTEEQAEALEQKRQQIREQIKDQLVAGTAEENPCEESGPESDAAADDFFL